MDDNKRSPLTHHVIVRINGERGDGWVESFARIRWDRRMSVGHIRMSHRKSIKIKGERCLGCHYNGILHVRHLNLSPNLLPLLGTLDVLSKCFFLVIIIIIEERKLWTIKRFPSTTTTPLFQPSCISSRHYVSLDQWRRPVGRVASNVIMCRLDIMRCKRVSGLVPWFRCIVSLLPSLRCLLPNELVDLDIDEGDREGRLGCT